MDRGGFKTSSPLLGMALKIAKWQNQASKDFRGHGLPLSQQPLGLGQLRLQIDPGLGYFEHEIIGKSAVSMSFVLHQINNSKY